jgi:hypothetical protein
LDYSRQDKAIDPGDNDEFNVTVVLVTPFTEVHTPSFRGVVYSGPTSFVGTSTYIGNGRHIISYNATASGMYNVSVRALSSSRVVEASSNFVDGQHIVGSPFAT